MEKKPANKEEDKESEEQKPTKKFDLLDKIRSEPIPAMIFVGFFVASALVGLGIQVIQVYREAKQERLEALEEKRKALEDHYEAKLGIANFRLEKLESNYKDLNSDYKALLEENKNLREMEKAPDSEKSRISEERIQNLNERLNDARSEIATLKQEKEQLELKTKQLVLGPPQADKRIHEFYSLQKKLIELEKELASSKRALKDEGPTRKIEYLHPTMRQRAKKFIERAKKRDVDVLIYDTLRSIQYQERLHVEKKTNARGGQSPHNFGLAFEAVPTVSGELGWDYDNYKKQWDTLGEIAKEVGLSWGGPDRAPEFIFPDWKNILFQHKLGFRIKTRDRVAAGSSIYDWISIIFSNKSNEKLDFAESKDAFIQEFGFPGSKAVKGEEFTIEKSLADLSFLDAKYIKIVNYGTNGWQAEKISIEVDGKEHLSADNILPNKGTSPDNYSIKSFNKSYWEDEIENIKKK